MFGLLCMIAVLYCKAFGIEPIIKDALMFADITIIEIVIEVWISRIIFHYKRKKKGGLK